MRILVISHEFPPIGGGGGHAALDICKGLVERKHEVYVITSHLKGLAHHETRNGIIINRVSSLRSKPYKANLLAMMGFVIAGSLTALRVSKSWHPDVVHVHFAVPAGPIAWLLYQLRADPYVLTAHLGDIPGGVPEKTSKWFRWIFPFTPPIWENAKQVVAVSDYSRQLAKKYYPVNINVIPNGVDLNALDPGDIKVNHTPRITFAGRFMPQKNPTTIVRVLSSLSDLDWECTLLGDGPLKNEVEQEIRKSGLENRFTLPGWVTPDEVIACFANSDILYMPSCSEGLPVVGVQALAMGLAIVASHVGGFVDIVNQGGNGYLYQPNDIEGMRNGLRLLLSDHDTLSAFRLNSREYSQRYDISKVVDDYIQIFDKAAKA